MSSAKNKKRWLFAIIAATTLSGGVAYAASPEPLQCLGRFVGAGWGDGYHACETSGFRPTANLPPKSYYQRFDRANGHGSSHCAPGSVCAGAINTLYGSDRQGCQGIGCDESGCDESGCDEYGCDAAPVFEFLNSAETNSADPTSLDQWPTLLEPQETTHIEQPVSQPEPVSAAADHAKGAIEELPSPKADKPKVKMPKDDTQAPSSPSDAPSILESSSLSPSHHALAIDLHESQMRPIRPLPPEPKRELTQPTRSRSTLDSGDLRRPTEMTVPFAPQGRDASMPNDASEPSNMLHLNQAGIRTNPFVVPTEPASSVAQRPTHWGGATGREPVASESTQRIAEVPERIFVTQPR